MRVSVSVSDFKQTHFFRVGFFILSTLTRLIFLPIKQTTLSTYDIHISFVTGLSPDFVVQCYTRMHTPFSYSSM